MNIAQTIMHSFCSFFCAFIGGYIIGKYLGEHKENQRLIKKIKECHDEGMTCDEIISEIKQEEEVAE